ncbi:MAG TPA: SAM-dependent methyltransferase [Actinomycetota bacterium]|nr:SAM-dependent methyltransferase [Actinomycetota bacterium]
MSDLVLRRIVDAIRERGPISFAEFMELALYGPGGFYERSPIGDDGHFVTSPHVHPVFAELVLRAVAELGDHLGRPNPLPVVEVGAGDGTLAGGLLRLAAERHLPISYTAVERSPGARERLLALGEPSPDLRGRLADVESLEGAVVIANELLDNLPFRRVRAASDGLVEVRVGVRGDRLVEVERPFDDQLESLAPALRPGEEAVVPVGALAFVDELASVLRRGYALLIDYGSMKGEGSAGEVHGYRRHAVLENVLAEPGSSDVTAGVELAAVAARAAAAGLVVHGSVRQRAALTALGFGAWSELQRGRQVRLMAEGSGSLAARIFQGRSRASLLVDPAALGSHWWLLLSTPSLPAPEWFRAAASEPAS